MGVRKLANTFLGGLDDLPRYPRIDGKLARFPSQSAAQSLNRQGYTGRYEAFYPRDR